MADQQQTRHKFLAFAFLFSLTHGALFSHSIGGHQLAVPLGPLQRGAEIMCQCGVKANRFIGNGIDENRQ
jgi:hypothetical protein